MGALLFSIFGCSNLYHLDLAEERRENLEQDLEFLKPRKAMVFTEPLSLNEAIRIGLENNLDFRIARLQEAIADDNALSEKLKMLPQLDVRGDLTSRNNYPLREYENLETGEISISNSVTEEKTQTSVSARLSWNILDFGLSYFRARQAAFGKEVRRMERLRQAQTLSLEISIAYWRAVLAERNLAYLRNFENSIREFKSAAEGMVSQKQLDPIIAKDIERQLASLAINAGDLQAEISGMRIELARLMGLSPLTRFGLAEPEEFKEIIATLPNPAGLEPEKLERISLHNRPELFAADLQEKIQQDEARAALISMFPGITFDAAYFYDDNQYLINNDWTTVGVGLVYNLLALPSQYMTWKAREKTVDVSRLQRLLLTAGVIVQVHMSLHDFQVKKKQFELYDSTFEISENLLEMVQERNKIGARGYSDTVVTQRMLESLVAKLERDKKLVEMLEAYHTLLISMGIEPDRWDTDIRNLDENEIPEAIPIENVQNFSISFQIEHESSFGA